MEADDFYVVIVGDQEKQESEECSREGDIKEELFETVQAEDELPVEFDGSKNESHGDIYSLQFDVKIEPIDGFEAQVSSEDIEERSKRQRHTLLKPWECRSYINELREDYPELKADEDMLITILCDIMRSVKPPAPPQDYIIVNDGVFECVKCGALTNTQPAASRHYQHKHGPRYLVCFACGVDFRSTTYLYKHEQRCLGPDAKIMLKARALYLGRKGRSRPYLRDNKFTVSNNPLVKRVKRKYMETAGGTSPKSYLCQHCPATFTNNVSLEAHTHLHSGSRPYQCDRCPAAYTSKRTLMQHTKTHTGVEYVCDHCERSFKAKKTLVVHMEIHRPLRKYWCEQCGCRYAQKTALTSHVNRKHLNLPPTFACSLCPKRYWKNSTLKDHMKKEHGSSLITRHMFQRKLPTLSEAELDEAKIMFNSDLTNVNDLVLMNDSLADDTKIDVQPILKKRIKRKKITNEEARCMEPAQRSFEELQCDVDPNTIIKNLNADIIVKKVKVKNVQNIKKRRKSRETVKFFAIQPMDGLVTLEDSVKRKYKPNSKPKKIYFTNIHKRENEGTT